MTERIGIDRAWEFTRQCSDAFLRGEPCPDAVPADLPHTCAQTPYHYFDESIYQMVCGYRRSLRIPEEWAGKRVFLHIEAAGHGAEVYLNGEKLLDHHCGYTAFRTELTDRLTPGAETVLAVRVDSRETQDIPPFGHVIDYMTYGGLYREAWLEVHEKSMVEDVFAKPETDAAERKGLVESEITLSGLEEGHAYIVRQTVSPWGRPEETAACAEARAETERLVIRTGSFPVKLWDLEDPGLYTVKTVLLRDGNAVDCLETRIGFRKAEFRTDGFYLNGRKVKIVGLNRHQSYPYAGYALPRSLQRYDADICKSELGLNAVRTSHYPQSQHFIDRCDELGLLVFTEIPGWQHIGGAAWKEQAVENTREMVTQYRNHPSVILWGVRINESHDCDELYSRTNELARRLDPTRPTSGVRYLKKSSFLEDVYAYNDFSHDGSTPGCEKKTAVTPDAGRPYLISEYNGHMFPTKTFDPEEHRLEHALRHANVLDAAAGEEDIAGSFGWCLADYNTHKDFGSGDRICYHGVLDMFRNPKLAAAVYSVNQDSVPVLEVSSSMDIGEHPASVRGKIFAFTNADSVRFYKNDVFIREYTHKDSPYKHLARPPIEISDFVGDLLSEEGFAPRQEKYVKELLNYSAAEGSSRLPLRIKLRAAWLMLRYRMSFQDAYDLFQKYIGNWGGEATSYRFEAVKDGKVVKTVCRTPMTECRLSVRPSHTELTEDDTYDAALLRLSMTDQNGNVLPFFSGPVKIETEGPVSVLGPETATLRGGLGGTFLRTEGRAGPAAVVLTAENADPVRVEFTVRTKEDTNAG